MDIYRKFYIRFFPALLVLLILSLRNSPGKIVYPSSEVSVRFLKILQIFQRPRLCTENSETWCVSFLCAADQEKNIKKIEKKEKSEKKNNDWSKNREKEKKQLHITRNTSKLCSSVFFFARHLFLSILLAVFSYTFVFFIRHLLIGTRLGQQLGQVLWTFIQHCYLFLNCVPHIY